MENITKKQNKIIFQENVIVKKHKTEKNPVDLEDLYSDDENPQ
jgi:uncharacterized pyridoxamine 5'-phosphate oxidase family protein